MKLLIIIAMYSLSGFWTSNGEITNIKRSINQDTIIDPIIDRNCDIVFNNSNVFFKQSNMLKYSKGKVVVNINLRKGKIKYWEITYLAFYEATKLGYTYKGKQTKADKYPPQVEAIIHFIDKKLNTGKINCKNLAKDNYTYLRLPFVLLPTQSKK